MENGPEIRIVGGASPEAIEEARIKIESAFRDNLEAMLLEDREILESREIPKNEIKIALIHFANREVGEFMREVGVEPYDVPIENYHILPEETYKSVRGGGSATTFYAKQGIFFDAQHF